MWNTKGAMMKGVVKEVRNVSTVQKSGPTRRNVIAGGAALSFAAPALAQPAKVVKFVPHADLTVVDPFRTTANVTRNHALLVHDTLYSVDEALTPQPQMVEGHIVEDDGLTWTLSLRDGLNWHDGEKVLARDCVASIRRWALSDSYGQTLLSATDELAAVDDRRLRFRLKRPFPLLPMALGKAGSALCAMMPERLAASDPDRPITDVVGSGPFRFVAADRIAGARVVYERNRAYVPRPGSAAGMIAGPKIVSIDRVEWHIIPDAATAGAALQAGEVDWWELPTADLLPLLRRHPAIAVEVKDRLGYNGFLRVNHLHPPFNDPAVRRALLHAVSQEDYAIAVAGTDPALWRADLGFFTPGTPMASTVGMEVLTRPRDLDRARREIAAAGHKGARLVVLAPSDISILKAQGDIGADLLARLGFAVDYQVTDWGTMVSRLRKMDPPDRGGWNVYHSAWAGLDQLDPAGHAALRSAGRALPRPGWPDSPKLEALRNAWIAARDPETQKQIAQDIQLQAFEDLPYIPIGQTLAPMAWRRSLAGVPDGLPVFWGLNKAA